MKKSLIFCSMFAAAMTAQAETGFYVLGSIGQSYFRDDSSKSEFNEFFNDGLTTTSSSLDKNDSGYKLQVGYRFNENIAIEGGYIDLGKLTYKSATRDSFMSESIKTSSKAEWEASGINVSVLAIAPLQSGFSLFAKFGVISAKTKLKLSQSGVYSMDGIPVVSDSDSESRSSTKIKALAGLGAEYNFYQGASVRFEWERFGKLGDENKTGEVNVDLFSLGLAYRF